MSFTIIQTAEVSSKTIYCSIHRHYIPDEPANSDFQAVLDAIIKDGAACFTGDIPADLQTAADTKQFAQQLADYKTATARLAQYIVSVGRTEVIESQPTGEQVWDDATGQIVNVMIDVITATAVDPVVATIDRLVFAYDPMVEPTMETIENPLITVDVSERDTAQAVVDSTPQPVKDAA